MINKNGEILDKKLVLDSFLKIYNCTVNVDGEVYNRMCMDRGNSVIITLYDPKKEAVVMVKESRIGPMMNGDNPFSTSFPAGVVDPGEQPFETAIKETKEETGATGNITVEAIGNKNGIYPSAGGCSEKLYFFYAEVDSDALPEVGGHDINEHMEVIIMPLKDFIKKDFNTAGAEIGKKLLIEKLTGLTAEEIIALKNGSNRPGLDRKENSNQHQFRIK